MTPHTGRGLKVSDEPHQSASWLKAKTFVDGRELSCYFNQEHVYKYFCLRQILRVWDGNNSHFYAFLFDVFSYVRFSVHLV